MLIIIADENDIPNARVRLHLEQGSWMHVELSKGIACIALQGDAQDTVLRQIEALLREVWQ